MPFDDRPKRESPVDGLGEEMIPDRGLPFDDIDDNDQPETGAEITSLDELNAEIEALDELDILIDDLDAPADIEIPIEEDSGMGAAYPILDEDAFDEQVEAAEAEIPIPTVESTEGMPVFADAHLDPSLTSSKHKPDSPAHSMGSIHLGETPADIFVTKERLIRLWERIDQAQQDIRENVPNLRIGRELNAQLDQARKLLLASPYNYEEVDRLTSDVQLRIEAIDRAKEDNSIAVSLFIFQLFWLALFLLGFLFFGSWLRDTIISGMGNDALSSYPTIASDMLILTNSAIAGGIGGVVAALVALWRHAAKHMDFSRQYSIWYIASPLMGVLLGGFVFVVLRVILLSLYIGGSPQEISSPWALYILSLMAGFWQDNVWQILRKASKALPTDGENES
jgi:hypothetical protein